MTFHALLLLIYNTYLLQTTNYLLRVNKYKITQMKTSQNQPKFSKFGQAFVNYGSYHYDTVNKIIHIVCIPLITASLFCLLSFVPYHLMLENLPLVGTVTFGAAQALFVLGIAYYLYLSPIFGVLAAVFMYGASFLWRTQFKSYSTEELFKSVLIIQIFAWGLQFVGHGFFQKRKPALMDNATQILNAPMFVLMELCEIVGFRTKQLELYKSEIKKNVFEYRQKSKKTQ